jgi:hypothetical protein
MLAPLQRFGIRFLIRLLFSATATAFGTARAPCLLDIATSLDTLDCIVIPDGLGHDGVLGREDPAERRVQQNRDDEAKQPVERVQVLRAFRDARARVDAVGQTGKEWCNRDEERNGGPPVTPSDEPVAAVGVIKCYFGPLISASEGVSMFAEWKKVLPGRS